VRALGEERMTVFLGCIADDFTGATDLAGLLARSGHPVTLHIGVPDVPPGSSAAGDTSPFEVIALKCRTAPVDEAVAETRAALRWLRAAGAKRAFWKYCSTFDSTPEGNIGPVSEALMEDLGVTQTIYCPAFPENSRTVFMGNLFVGRQPLHESSMKDHPLTPMRDSNLVRLLEPQVTRPVGLVDRLTVARGADAVRASLADLAAQGVAHVVMDAVADADLQTIAEACHEMLLLTGGSAVAMPLPALHAGAKGAPPVPGARSAPFVDAPAIVLSGSCSATTRSQVDAYPASAPRFQLDPLQLARTGTDAALDWLANVPLNETPLVFATSEPNAVAACQAELGVAEAARVVEAAMEKLAVTARDAGRRRYVVAGGETSGAVTQALGVRRLEIGAEIVPGVPWTYTTSAGERIALTLKSGNFGSRTFFTDALTKLELS
jgi:uncharacterized protein YgbK (DUF1537 family)